MLEVNKSLLSVVASDATYDCISPAPPQAQPRPQAGSTCGSVAERFPRDAKDTDSDVDLDAIQLGEELIQ